MLSISFGGALLRISSKVRMHLPGFLGIDTSNSLDGLDQHDLGLTSDEDANHAPFEVFDCSAKR